MREYTNFEFDPPLVKADIPNDLKVIIAIPSFYEKDLYSTLSSLQQNSGYKSNIEVIIVINESEDCNSQISTYHQNQLIELLDWSAKENTKSLSFYPIYVKGIKKKIAGAGMARKIGMDEAYRRFKKANNLFGIISNLDADTLVAENYLFELEKEAEQNNKIKAYSIHYEHFLPNELTKENKLAIVSYELHLRYYINMQKLLKLPYAYQTMGSAMAVKAFAYAEAFGMNKRQAGEDFYFLQKFVNTGYFKNLNTTTVFPSARISQRVPFGTGRALYDILTLGKIPETYSFKSFIALESFINNIEKLYQDYDKTIDTLEKPILEYLESKNFKKIYLQIKKNTKDITGFKKRLFQWFDAFLLMKYLHYSRDNYYQNIQIDKATDYIFSKLEFEKDLSLEQRLIVLQKFDRKEI